MLLEIEDRPSFGMILTDQAIQELPAYHEHRLVCEYWNHDMGWDWDLLSQYRPYTLPQLVASFKLIQEEVGDNLF